MIAGIDYSIRSPAMCIHPKNSEWNFYSCFFVAVPTGCFADSGLYDNRILLVSNEPTKAYEQRFDETSETFIRQIGKHGVSSVLFEQYAFGASGRIFHIAENCGVLKHKIYKEGIPISYAAPSTLKKHGTGNGRSNKNDLYDAFVEQTGYDLLDALGWGKKRPKNLPSPVDDIVDAYCACRYHHEQLNTKSTNMEET